MKISKISAIEILDSRGNPTVKAYVELENGVVGSAAVPSGASTGTYEAVELRDNDKRRYQGKGVQNAVTNVNSTLASLLVGHDISDLSAIDQKMITADGTENKSKLGANAILAVSLAATRAYAQFQQKPLWHAIHEYYFTDVKVGFPRLMANIVNGGRHADWQFDLQEFMICPIANKPSESVRIASEIFHSLGKKIKEKKLLTLVGDEGGYAPAFNSNEEVFETIDEAAESVEYKRPVDYTFALDCAASEFYENGTYLFKKTNEKKTAVELTEYYSHIGQKYTIQSFEDAFAEDDWEAFTHFTSMANQFKFIVVGDDLFVTNPKRIKTGIDKKAANALLVKVNQIGSLYETVEAIKLCRENNWKVIISHRSGETEDSFIADLAVACGADFIKTGSLCRSDRVAKYNRLIEIEKREI